VIGVFATSHSAPVEENAGGVVHDFGNHERERDAVRQAIRIRIRIRIRADVPRRRPTTYV
jgi:hypothetical protein